MATRITLIGIHKRYPRTETFKDVLTFWRREYIDALRGVDLDIPANETVGILGPNGAGKTTMLKILAGLVLPDAGRIVLGGVDVTDHSERIPERLMYVFGEERSLNWRLSGRDNLMFYAALYEVPRRDVGRRITEVLDVVGLSEFANERVMKYSTGMRHRLVIARGLLSDPEILLLDEPTRSLDPVGAKRIWDFIKETLIQERGTTVIIATHNMTEAAYLCSKVAILSKGEIVAYEPIDDLTKVFGGRQECAIDATEIPDGIVKLLQGAPGVSQVKIVPQNGNAWSSIRLLVEEPDLQLPMVVRTLVISGANVISVASQKRDLTDVIMQLSEGQR